MKKTITIIVAIITICSVASAQSKYKEVFEAGASTIVGDNHGFSFQLDNSHGFVFGSSYIGLGYGFETYELLKGGRRDMNKTIPLFLNYRYLLADEKKVSGFVDLKAGLFAMMNDTSFGGFLEGGLGGRMDTKGRLALSVSLFFRRAALPHYNGCERILNNLNIAGFKLALDL